MHTAHPASALAGMLDHGLPFQPVMERLSFLPADAAPQQLSCPQPAVHRQTACFLLLRDP